MNEPSWEASPTATHSAPADVCGPLRSDDRRARGGDRPHAVCLPRRARMRPAGKGTPTLPGCFLTAVECARPHGRVLPGWATVPRACPLSPSHALCCELLQGEVLAFAVRPLDQEWLVLRMDARPLAIERHMVSQEQTPLNGSCYIIRPLLLGGHYDHRPHHDQSATLYPRGGEGARSTPQCISARI